MPNDDGVDDVLIGDHVAIEAKAKENIDARDLKSLVAIGEEGGFTSLICVALAERTRQIGSVTIMPWREFLAALWAGEFE